MAQQSMSGACCPLCYPQPYRMVLSLCPLGLSVQWEHPKNLQVTRQVLPVKAISVVGTGEIVYFWVVPDSRQTLLISLVCCPLEGHIWDRLTTLWTCQYKAEGRQVGKGQELSIASSCCSPPAGPLPSVSTAAFCPLPLPSDWSLAGSYMQANYKRHHPNNVAIPVLGCFLFSPNWPESQITHFPTLLSGRWSLCIIIKMKEWHSLLLCSINSQTGRTCWTCPWSF